MSDISLTQDENSLLAAEYLLGLLDDDAHAAAMRLRMTDGDFAEAVSRWEIYFAPLLDRVAEVSPPAEIWTKLTARINAERSGIMGGAEAANDNDGTRLWKGFAFVSSALAACLLAFAVLRPAPSLPPAPAPAEQVFAQLSSKTDGISVAARFDPEAGLLRISSSGIESGDKVPVLWVIPAGEKPLAMGELPTGPSASLPVADGLRALVAAGAVLAVTMEAPADAPYPAPTSEAIASGKISKI